MLDRLSVTFNYENEWPPRIGELIAHLSEWYAAHPSVTQDSAADIAAFLDGVLFDKELIHSVSCISIELDVTGRTLQIIKLVIDYRELCLALASVASERYILPDVMRNHVAA